MKSPFLFRLSLLAWALLAAAGCMPQNLAPPTQCQAWQAGEAAWRAACEYGAQQLASQRAAACVPLQPAPPAPPPQEGMPAEVPPRQHPAPPPPTPLPGGAP
jgi:hypothetical protein